MLPERITAAMLEEQGIGQSRRAANLQFALQPIRDFLDEAGVVEIMLNADGSVWVDRLGRGLEFTGVWMDAPRADRMLRAIAAELKLELHAHKPSLACKLPIYGARVQALIPPVTAAPIFAFRRPTSTVLSLDFYVEQGVLSAAQVDALREAVQARANILIGGGTGSGKTTFANALLREIAQGNDRILTVEDTPELVCDPSAHRVALLVCPPVYTWQHAVIDAMRMRPDRIIVGEVRDGSALDLLKSWNTGHPGGLATIHANDTHAMLDRFGQLVDEVLPQYPRSVIASTVNVCVHLARAHAHPAGRVVTGIDRVVGYAADAWILQPLVPPNTLARGASSTV